MYRKCLCLYTLQTLNKHYHQFLFCCLSCESQNDLKLFYLSFLFSMCAQFRVFDIYVNRMSHRHDCEIAIYLKVSCRGELRVSSQVYEFEYSIDENN